MQRTHPSQVLSRNIGGDSKIVGPVLQFSLLIVPLVMNCFFLVYALSGWVVSGRDKFNWSLEAPGVARWVCAGMLVYCALVLVFVRWRAGGWRHLLSLSSIFHAVLAVLLLVSVFISVKAG